MFSLEVGQTIEREVILEKLIEMLYERNDIDFKRGLAALIFSNDIIIVDIENNTKPILMKEHVEYGSSVHWVDDETLLIATWKGLFLMKAEL